MPNNNEKSGIPQKFRLPLVLGGIATLLGGLAIANHIKPAQGELSLEQMRQECLKKQESLQEMCLLSVETKALNREVKLGRELREAKEFRESLNAD